MLTFLRDASAARFFALRRWFIFRTRLGRSLHLRKNIAALNCHFDRDFYLRENADVREAGIDPLQHYILYGWKEGRDPTRYFSTNRHLFLNPHLAITGRNPFYNFLKHRARMAEAPASAATTQENAVRDEIDAGNRFADTYDFRFDDPDHIGAVCEAAEDLNRMAAPPFWGLEGSPDVSIIIPVYGQARFALTCLHSLATHKSRYRAEIILVDDASPEDAFTEDIGRIEWIKYVRNKTNLGFLDTCNSAARIACGRYIVLLNSDTRVAAGWLDELIGTFDIFPNAGLAGSKLYHADGSLQEAGGIVWQDGSAWNYGRNQDPDDPRYSFARQADYCSGAAIALPAALWRKLKGFDRAYRPAYAEDTDLAFRVREAGRQVIMQPLARVVHYEGKTHGTDILIGLKAYQERNLKRLAERWREILKSHAPNAVKPDSEANRPMKKRLLMVDAMTPTPDRDSGSVITDKMMTAFQELGYQITFIPEHNYTNFGAYTQALQRRGIECMYAPHVWNIHDVLQRREFDLAIVYRHNVASTVFDPIRETKTPIIFHNVDLHYLRETREAELQNSNEGLEQAARTKAAELDIIRRSDCVIVHTPVERRIIEAETGVSNIVEFPYIADVNRSSVAFEERKDILFLGGFAHPPNTDAVEHFLANIWPDISRRLPEARFVIVGADAPDSIRAHDGGRVFVAGHVPVLQPWFDSARVFVCPLRYGAGIKGKLVQSLAHGLPAVASTIAVEGIGLTSGENVFVSDDAGTFADMVVSLYENEARWSTIQAAGYDFVAERFSWEEALRCCRAAISMAEASQTRTRNTTPTPATKAKIKPKSKQAVRARPKPAAGEKPEAKARPKAKRMPEAKVAPKAKPTSAAKVTTAAVPKAKSKTKPAARMKPALKVKAQTKPAPKAAGKAKSGAQRRSST